MTANYRALRYECHEGVATITFDNAATRNSFDAQLRDELAEVVGRVRDDADVRCVIVTGAHGHFCSGGDLRGLSSAALDAPGWRERFQRMHHWLRDWILLDKPLIAAVDGSAFGAGFSLTLAADFILATPRARFCMSFLRIGLMPDAGALYTLPRKVGAQRARELMLSAREVGGPEALMIGLAMELHEPEALLPRAQALAQSISAASPVAVSLIKRALAEPGVLAAVAEAETQGQAMALATAEHRAAVQRFFDKQPPAFRWPAAPTP